MTCPRCEVNALEERAQGGVVIDVCAGCRGIWLDRGELEKLLARARREDDDDDDDDDAFGGRRRHRRDEDDDRDQVLGAGPAAPRRKRRWYEAFGEIFD